MLEAGSKAPEFVLQDDRGTEKSLSELLHDGPLILFFYPADFTPGCTKEACTIRDLHQDVLSVGLQVAGISPQDQDSHSRFRKKYNLPFVLLSDSDKVAIKMYGVDGPFGVGVRRATFLIRQDRTVQSTLLAYVQISRHKKFIDKVIILRETAGMKLARPD